MQVPRHRRSSANSTRLPLGSTASRKQTQLPAVSSGGTAVSRVSPYSNTAPSKSNSSASPSVPSIRATTLEGIREISIIRRDGQRLPVTSFPLTGTPTSNLTKGRSSFHFPKMENASSDEIMFLLSVREFGLKPAMWLAAKFHWKYQRPLQALRAKANASGRSYTSKAKKR